MMPNKNKDGAISGEERFSLSKKASKETNYRRKTQEKSITSKQMYS